MGWPHHDRDLIIAWMRVERNTGRYGEWLPDAVTKWPDPPKTTITHDGPYINWHEKSAKDAEDEFRKRPNANLNGLFWSVDAGDASAPLSD